MMYMVYGDYRDSIGQMIAGHFVKNTGNPITGAYTAMGLIKDGELVGQAIFNDYTGSNIEIHLYAPKCLSKKTIKDIYKYVFKTLKCERLTAKPYCTNEKLLQILKRIGFVYEFTQEKYYRENDKIVDAVVYKLTKETIPKWVNIDA